MGELEIQQFLTHLAVNNNCAPATQNQALKALVFLFGTVLSKELRTFKIITWAKRKQRIPPLVHRILFLAS